MRKLDHPVAYLGFMIFDEGYKKGYKKGDTPGSSL
jgi:hypothetical protein